MFPFSRKKADVLKHWIAFIDGFETSPLEFYDTVAKKLAEKQIPSMEITRLELPEGGLLSENRIYLRMLRERLVFDVCAAKFGTGFFFSCRSSEIPVVVNLWSILILLGLTWLAAGVSFALLYDWTRSVFISVLIIVTALAFGIYLLRNIASFGLRNLDTILTRLPIFGSVYERFFRKETYYRIDSRLCYVDIVPRIVKKVAEDIAASNGVRLERQFEHAPIIGELYRPVSASELKPVSPGTPS